MKILAKKARNSLVWKMRALRRRYIDNFVFIHINKTGGSSVERALKLPFEHKTALEKINDIGYKKWCSRYTFTVVRNPWDKVVSHYHYRVQTNQTKLLERTVEFKDWVKLSYGSRDSFYCKYPRMFIPQFDWISDRDGNMLVDFVCRFENLDDDFSHVCEKLGKTVELPHVKASERGHYRGYYDEETIEIVASRFKKDIDVFGYHF